MHTHQEKQLFLFSSEAGTCSDVWYAWYEEMHTCPIFMYSTLFWTRVEVTIRTLFSFYITLFYFVWSRVSLCKPGWFWTPGNPPALVSWVWASMPNYVSLVFFFFWDRSSLHNSCSLFSRLAYNSQQSSCINFPFAGIASVCQHFISFFFICGCIISACTYVHYVHKWCL